MDIALEAGAVERARELLHKALAAKDSKEALKICENFELQVSPARARVVLRFAASAAQGAEPPASRHAERGRARARAGSLSGAGSGTSGRYQSAARWRAPAGSCAHWSAEIPLSRGERPQQIQRRRRTALCGRKAASETELRHLSRALVSQQSMVFTAPWPCAPCRPDCAVLFRAVSRVLPLLLSPCAALWGV
jgi:hypothetical protein